MTPLDSKQIEKLSIQFDKDLIKFQHFKNYPNFLPYIGKDYSNVKNKILIIAESHYFPNEKFYNSIQIEYFYQKKVNFQDINFMNTRFELTRKKRHKIHDRISKFVMYSEIAYYNFFLRPAQNKSSIIVSSIDQNIANDAFSLIVDTICPDKIIFVSKKSYDSLSKMNKKLFREKISYCVHPNSYWWYKPMKKYNGKKGKEIFKTIIEDVNEN